MKRSEWAIATGVILLVAAVVAAAVTFATPHGGRRVEWELYWDDVPRPAGGYYVILGAPEHTGVGAQGGAGRM